MSTNRTYSGPKYPNADKISKVSDLDNAMQWLVQQGSLPGARIGNAPCNGGETIEAALNQPPSTKKIDFKLSDGKVELKSGRQRIGKSPDSLATRVLDSWTSRPFPGKTRSERYDQFVNRFAYRSVMKIDGVSRSYNRKNLSIRLSDKVHKKTGLYLELDGVEERIWICVGKSSKKEKLLFYDEIDISAIMEKMKLQYYAKIEQKSIGNNRFEYDVKEVQGRRFKLPKLTTKSLFEAIKSGLLSIELRAHICNNTFCKDTECHGWVKRGPGHVRCHGTAIRIDDSKISDVFELTKIA
jgi:hypothetical protein